MLHAWPFFSTAFYAIAYNCIQIKKYVTVIWYVYNACVRRITVHGKRKNTGHR
jgi:hypothetical protein